MSQSFVVPPWDAPLDVEECLRNIPDGATTKGMFLLPMLVEAKRRGLTLPSARERYLPFVDYPVAEHARLLVESASAFYPELSTRLALRRLGHRAVDAFRHSTVGKVMWSGATDPLAALDVIAKGYAITSSRTSVEVVESAPGMAKLRVSGVHWFLDSHHVAVFEGILKECGVVGSVRIRLDSPSDGALLCEWS